MSGLFGGGGGTISSETPRVSALRINASAYGLVVPLVWGTARVSGNLIWYGDFTAIAHTTEEEVGGKGGGETTVRSTTYTYTVAFAMGLCSGEISSIGQVWSGKDKTSTSALGLSVFPGTLPQSPWAYLTSKHAGQALGYNGLAYVASGAFDLGNSSSLPNLSFEVRGPRRIGEITAGNFINDARPDEILNDLLTAALPGARFPSDRIGNLSNWRDYCQANGFFLSPALTEQAPAKDRVRDLCRMTNAEPVWSEGELKIVPRGDTEVTGNGVVWTPDVTPAYDLTDDDFLTEGDDEPVRVLRSTPADAKNYVKVEFLNGSKEYNIDLGEAKDAANIAQFGLRPKDPIKMHWITRREMADAIADIEMRKGLYIRNEYGFRLGWRFVRLEPMDIVTLTHAPLGLSRAVVRIVSIEENEFGDLDVVAEEMPWAVASPARITTQDGSGATVDFNVAPGNANLPVIFEPPVSLAGRPELWLATSGGVNWGGAEVWVSLDDATYTRVGSVTNPARHGILSAAFASGGDPDVSSTLAVDLGVSRGELLGGTVQDRDLLLTLCWVDGELVSYQNATLTGINRYDLTSLRRGAYGTPIGAHAQNTAFVRLDGAVFKYPYDPALVGETLYVKLRSYNIYGGGMQELASLTPLSHAIAGAPVGAVGGLTAEQPFTGRSAKIRWQEMTGATGYRVEVWAASALRRSVDMTDTRFEYGFEDALADGGPWRTLQFRVFALTGTGVSDTPAMLQLTNPQVGAPQSVSVDALLEGLAIRCAKPGDTDYAGCRVWASQTSGFDPGVTVPVYDGLDTSFSYYGLTADDVWYLRIGCHDVFGTDGMTLSTEFAVTVRGISADPATMLNEINTLLTDGSGTAKIELLADRFSIQSPSGDKIPFGLVESEPGVWKALLNADVLIGGNVSVANLTDGALPNDVIFSLGGGVVQLDGAGEVRAYAALGSNQDFVSLTAAQINFMRYIPGTGYVTYNYLSRLETGVANSGDTVAIPGYWKQQPRVMVSPAALALYKATYVAQDQSIACLAENLQETSPGSGQWQFVARATLNLSANTGITAINESSGAIAANTWTSSTKTTAANTVSITPTVSLLSVRGNGTSQYFHRSVRWRVEYFNAGSWVTTDPWRVVNIGAQITTPVADSKTFTFPSSGAWQWRITAEAYDTNGSVFGAMQYTYDQETLTQTSGNGSATATCTTAFQTVNANTSITLANKTKSGEIYQMVFNWTANVTINGYYAAGYQTCNTMAGRLCTSTQPSNTFSGGRAGSVAASPSGFTYQNFTPETGYNRLTWSNRACSHTVSGSNLTYTPTTINAALQAMSEGTPAPGGVQVTTTLSGGSVTISYRTPVANSTTPSNTYGVTSVGWSLSAAQVLATGTLNWQAVGV